jgi:hypothetical protein
MKQILVSHILKKNDTEVETFVTRKLTKEDTQIYQQEMEILIPRFDVSIVVGLCENSGMT